MAQQQSTQDSATQPTDSGTENLREVNYHYSPGFPLLLEQLQASVLISTYQAGKLVVLSARAGKLELAFHNFDRPMGVAIGKGQIAVGARTQIWFLKSAPDIARQMQPVGSVDACFLTRRSQVTGEIQCHEMAFAGDELWVVNTLFSCLCTLHADFNFISRWQPPFISSLAAEDRCHLNGIAMADGRPKFVTAMAETDAAGGWRANKVQTGCLIDVTSNEIVVRGFAMPHSPRVHAGKVLLLDSGRGQLVRVDPANAASKSSNAGRGQWDIIAEVPGYARGLAIHGNYAFIGLSKIRETSTFGGVPIAERRDELRCGVGVVELSTGRTIATFQFTEGVDEIFDVSILPGIRHPQFRGPHATEDGHPAIWVVPQPK